MVLNKLESYMTCEYMRIQKLKVMYILDYYPDGTEDNNRNLSG
jgi:hypothetical protein